MEGQVLGADATQLTLGRILPHGVVSTPVPWESLLPASVVRFYNACRDPNSVREQFACAVLLAHFSIAGQVPTEEARRELQAVAPRDPAHQATIESLVLRLEKADRLRQQEVADRAALQIREQKAAISWAQISAVLGENDIEAIARELPTFLALHKDTDCARTHQAEIERLQRLLPAADTLAPFVPLDLGSIDDSRQIISTATQDAANPLDGTRTLATSGYFRQHDIPLPGLPDNGRLIVRFGNQRVLFQLRVDQAADALVLVGEGQRRITSQIVNLGGRQRQPYSKLAVLFAAPRGNSSLELYPRQPGSEFSSLVLQVWNWLNPPAADNKNIATVATTATDKRRVVLGAQLLPLDGARRLLGLHFVADNSTTDTSIAILAISAQPAH